MLVGEAAEVSGNDTKWYFISVIMELPVTYLLMVAFTSAVL